jgi:hypothetical protein
MRPIRLITAMIAAALAVSGHLSAQIAEVDPRTLVAGSLPGLDRIADGDLDGDGDRDIAATNGESLVWFESNCDTDPGFTIRHTVAGGLGGGGAIRLADLDGDGDLDVLAGTRPGTQSVVWFENRGGVPPEFIERVLGPLPPSALAATINAVTTADLDGDADADVIAGFSVNPAAPGGHVSWYRNNGGSPPSFTRFSLPSPPSLLAEITGVTTGDFDGDGDIDLAATSVSPAFPAVPDALVRWISTGGPTPGFAQALISDTLVGPAAVRAGLLNNDALPELAVAEAGSGRVSLFLNPPAAPGQFTFAGSQPAPGAVDLVIARLVGTGARDVLVAGASSLLVLENTGGPGGGGFVPRTIPLLDGPAGGIAAGDFDGDGDSDPVTAHPAAGAVRWYERVEPVVNQTTLEPFSSLNAAGVAAASGDTLSVPQEHLAGPVAISLPPIPLTLDTPAGVDLDPRASLNVPGALELLVPPGEGITLRGSVSVASTGSMTALGSVPLTLGGPVVIPQGAGVTVHGPLRVDLPPTLSVEELDGQFVAIPPGLLDRPRDVQAFALASGAGVAAISSELGGGGLGQPGSLAVYTRTAGMPGAWTGTAVDTASFGTHRALAVGDLDRDGDDDLITVFVPAVGTPVLRLHHSDGELPPVFTSTSAGPWTVTGPIVAADLNRDGLVDLVTASGYGLNLGAGLGFQFIGFPATTGARGLGVAVADFDHDGTPDIASHVAITDAFGDDTGYRVVIHTTGAGIMPAFIPTVVASVDFACPGGCYPLLNADVSALNTLGAADLDHDGDPDLLLSEDAGVTLFENVAGPGGMVQTLAGVEFPWSALDAIDADADGDLDVAVASPGKSRVALLRTVSSGPLTLKPETLLAPFERASGVAVYDFDGDDRDDLAVVGSAFDRVSVITRQAPGMVTAIGPGVPLSGLDGIEVAGGTLRLVAGATLAGTPEVLIGPRGTIVGDGAITGDLFNAGRLEPDPMITVAGDYAQFSPADSRRTGTLRIGLPTPGTPNQLIIQQDAFLAGDLVVNAPPGTVLPDSGPPIRVVRSGAIDEVFDRFDRASLPNVLVQSGLTLAPGSLEVGYDPTPGDSSVDLGGRGVSMPDLTGDEFDAIARPADAVVADLIGNPAGGPDGIDDLVVAYPTVPGGPLGGVALFLGEELAGICRFRPLALYVGQFADSPVAVEAGDYDGDGLPEVAFANRGDQFVSNTVHLLRANSAAPQPLTDLAVGPVPFTGDRAVSDLETVTLGQGLLRGAVKQSIVITSSTATVGVATVATYDEVQGDWDLCDIDVCDDPDSVDSIDPDGVALMLGEGFVSTSMDEDKIVVASNTGVMPDLFPTQTFATGSDPGEVRAEDLNNDGFADIAVINVTSGTVSVFENVASVTGPGGRSFALRLDLSLRAESTDPDPLPGSIALADLDDDGDLDIAVVSTDGSGARAVRELTNLFVETGTLAFSAVENLDEQPAGVPVLVREADADLPGAMMLNDDLVVLIDGSGGAPRGGSPWVRGPQPPGHVLFCSAIAVCLADVNGDGSLTPADFSSWIQAYNAGTPACDQNGDGQCTPADFSAWIQNYNAGC